MQATDAGHDGTRTTPGGRRIGGWPLGPLRTLLLGAVAAGALTFGAAGTVMHQSATVQETRTGRSLDDALALLRLAATARSLAGSATQLETAATTPDRQEAHPALNRQAQRLGDALDPLLRGAPDRLPDLRGAIGDIQAGVEDLNRLVDRRLTVERDLNDALARVPVLATSLAETLGPLSSAEARRAVEAQGWALGVQLLAAGLVPLPQPDHPADDPVHTPTAVRVASDALLAALDAQPIDPLSARRAEAGRRLVALGVDGGNIFDLRREQGRLLPQTAAAARLVRDRAALVSTLAEAEAQKAHAPPADADAGTVPFGLLPGPFVVGLLTALSVFAAGAATLWAAQGTAARPTPRPRVKTRTAEPAPAAPHRFADDRFADNCADTPLEAHAQAPTEAPDDLPDEVPPLHILLAEDEPVNQMAAKALLGRAGHTVTVAADGRAALDAVTRERFDLVLMDLRMPEMDGIETTRRIRALPDPHRARLRVVMLTASAIPGDRERSLAVGADAVLEKPLRMDRLQPVLERLYAIDLDRHYPAAPPPEAGAPLFDDTALRQMREHLPAERVAALVAGTVRTLRQYHAELAAAWAAGDMATVSAMAHKIAGVSGLYGCMALRHVAQALERAVETGDGDPAALHARLDSAVPPALAALQGQLADA